MKKNLNFAAVINTIIRTVMAVVLVVLFNACSSEDMFEEVKGAVSPAGEYTFTNDKLTHDIDTVCEVRKGETTDDMTATVTVARNGETRTYTNYPQFEVSLNMKNKNVPTIENYILVLSDFTATAGDADVYNNGDYYERTQDWNGGFKANGESVELVGKNLDFAKFFSASEKVLQLPGTTVDSLTLAGYVIDSISDEIVDGKKKVTFKVMVNAYRTEFGAEKVTENQLSTRSNVTRSAGNQMISPVGMLLTFNVPAGVEPIDEYTGYGNVKQTVNYNWDKMVVEVKVTADEYWTLSGTKTVVVEETELPFGYSASGTDTYESVSKTLKEGAKSSDVNSAAEVNRRQKHTMVNTYALSLSETVCNKKFTFWWTTGYTEKDGDRIDFNIVTPTQTYAGYTQVSETSDNTYKTITTYDVKNTIAFGGSKTNASQIVVKVKKDEEKPVTVENVVLSQNKVEEDSRTKITVTADITYSDGTTAKADTIVYRAHGASNAAAINVNKDNKSVVYVSNNVSSASSNGKINYTNAVTLRYVDNSTDVMNFASFQEEGGTITFWGKSIALNVEPMVPSYVSLVEGSTTTSGSNRITAWTVNAKSVIGAKTLNQTGNVNVTVLDYVNPTKGRLIDAMASYSACNSTASKLWDIVVLKWEMTDGSIGYEIEADGTMQSRFWKASELDSSIEVTSATSMGPDRTWMPACHSVNTKDGYWNWVSKDANGNQYYSSFPYKMYAQYQNKPNYCKRSVTCEFVGDKMNVIENGVVIRSYSRQ